MSLSYSGVYFCSPDRVLKWTEGLLYWKLYLLWKCKCASKTGLDLNISYWMHWFIWINEWMKVYLSFWKNIHFLLNFWAELLPSRLRENWIKINFFNFLIKIIILFLGVAPLNHESLRCKCVESETYNAIMN